MAAATPSPSPAPKAKRLVCSWTCRGHCPTCQAQAYQEGQARVTATVPIGSCLK